MDIDIKHIKSILCFFKEAYPYPVEDIDKLQDELVDEKNLIGHLVYLYDKQLIDGDFEFSYTQRDKPWDININSIRINAEGIDYLKKITTSRGAVYL
ncbi:MULTISPECIES: hypothetical protein [Lonsdalea]|uniref:Uncharacterized protein n=2 Tax=Lonsdalea TaxID=1082702 RepID=A0ACD1JG91_9GAMM|nr:MULTISPECIES: hypothetical protein [Lonsdalea]RAT16194.1 hypothetical protein AU485_01910 [Lonsdalea quercina]RAT23887.1 hypothetical protein AU487_00645 [Lonsdalea populi]RAT25444.1 hypothetical protein AU489_07010 [Lonsdalea populi]RAT28500.1 hypothetical protein AU488_00550 [Lonsdalea populi]RAT38306.1 hypothetical protein AU492_00590 [Lonsdalea populi]